MSVKDLETAVKRLPPEDLNAFADWFEEFLADAWDRRIEADIAAGRLDEAGRKADALPLLKKALGGTLPPEARKDAQELLAELNR